MSTQYRVGAHNRQVYIAAMSAPHVEVWSGSPDDAEALAKELWAVAKQERDWQARRRRFDPQDPLPEPSVPVVETHEDMVREDAAVAADMDRRHWWEDADYYPDNY